MTKIKHWSVVITKLRDDIVSKCVQFAHGTIF